jgi:hypothetical protein
VSDTHILMVSAANVPYDRHSICIFHVQEGVHYVKEIDSFLDSTILLVESGFANWLGQSPYSGISY